MEPFARRTNCRKRYHTVRPCSSFRRIIDHTYQTALSDCHEYFLNVEFKLKEAEDLLPKGWTIAYDQIALNHPVRKITVGNTLNKTLTYQENDTIIDIKGERGLNLIFDKRKGD